MLNHAEPRMPETLMATLPRVPRASAAAILDFLQAKYAIKRPPLQTASLLAFICELHKRGLPFPTRQEASEHIGMSVFGIDGAIAAALARGLITLEIEVQEGNIARREGVVKFRHYVPSPELLSQIGSKE